MNTKVSMGRVSRLHNIFLARPSHKLAEGNLITYSEQIKPTGEDEVKKGGSKVLIIQR